jgi:hypothetical protein
MKVYLYDLGSYEFPAINLIDWDEVYKDVGVDRKTNDVYDEKLFMLSVLKYGIFYMIPTMEQWKQHRKEEMNRKTK